MGVWELDRAPEKGHIFSAAEVLSNNEDPLDMVVCAFDLVECRASRVSEEAKEVLKVVELLTISSRPDLQHLYQVHLMI